MQRMETTELRLAITANNSSSRSSGGGEKQKGSKPFALSTFPRTEFSKKRTVNALFIWVIKFLLCPPTLSTLPVAFVALTLTCQIKKNEQLECLTSSPNKEEAQPKQNSILFNVYFMLTSYSHLSKMCGIILMFTMSLLILYLITTATLHKVKLYIKYLKHTTYATEYTYRRKRNHALGILIF